MRTLRRLIPSMFHRRLLLLMVLFLLGNLLLSAQMVRLTVVKGDELRAEAESKLVRRAWTPTVRGRIVDRHGRVLAHDRASFDVAVDYGVLTGDWAEREARRVARRAHRETWFDLTEEQRERLVAGYRRQHERHVESMWRTLARTLEVEPEELARTREVIIERVERAHARLIELRREQQIREREELGLRTRPDDLARIERRARDPIREQRIAHTIATSVDDELGFRLMRMAEQRVPLMTWGPGGEARALDATVPLLPGLEVRNSAERSHPFETVTVDIDMSAMPGPLREDARRSVTVRGVGGHMLGRVRDGTYREDYERRARALREDPELASRALLADGTDLGSYREQDAAGHTGLEHAFEHRLRGLRGLLTEHLQTGEVAAVEARPGQDVHLSVDIMLEARIRAIMDPELGLARVQAWHDNGRLPEGTVLNGAAVVLDVETGEILAMVSTPGVPRDGVWVEGGTEANSRFVRVNQPHVNRAIAKPYPPGSIAKALIICGGVVHGHHRLDGGIVCRGHLLEGRPDIFRCWIYRDRFGFMTHSPAGMGLLGAEALQVSCNIFFYTLGQRMGPRTVAKVYREYGLLEPFDLGAGSEWPGQIGQRGDGSDLGVSDAILMAIGQGPVSWTPLHAADAYATIARGGYRIRPRLARAGDGAPEVVEVPMDRRAASETLEGLSLAVNHARGTGHALRIGDRREPIFNVPGVAVWGKTGTATAPDLVIDLEDGEQIVRRGDHSWFVVLAGPEGAGPRYAIAVVMDYAGSGGRVSGPITNQIIHALVAEGYLPRVGGGRRAGL